MHTSNYFLDHGYGDYAKVNPFIVNCQYFVGDMTLRVTLYDAGLAVAQHATYASPGSKSLQNKGTWQRCQSAGQTAWFGKADATVIEGGVAYSATVYTNWRALPCSVQTAINE